MTAVDLNKLDNLSLDYDKEKHEYHLDFVTRHFDIQYSLLMLSTIWDTYIVKINLDFVERYYISKEHNGWRHIEVWVKEYNLDKAIQIE